jgi:endonuclease/exonuclease/phosphatase family metal-dependent hydrolase
MPELTLVSFNAHGGVLPGPIVVPGLRASVRSPRGVPYDLAAVLRGFDTDVIVVQESYRPDHGACQAEAAARDLGFELYEAPFGRAVVSSWPHLVRKGTGTKGLAVLTRFPARRLADLPVPRVPADPATSRVALHLELDVGGELLELVALHLTSRLPYGPPIQMRRLRLHLPPLGRRAVVAGDFNFWGPPVCALLPGWRRAVRGRTWPARRPHSQIDHVLVRELDVVDAAVLGNFGSDHRPVRVTLGVG